MTIIPLTVGLLVTGKKLVSANRFRKINGFNIPTFNLMPHIHLTILIAEVPPHFLSLQARSHFHAACCFAHDYCTTFLS